MLWTGSDELEKIEFALKYLGYKAKNRNYYLIVETEKKKEELENDIQELLNERIEKEKLCYPHGICIPNKFNEYIPDELLETEFLEDYLLRD